MTTQITETSSLLNVLDMNTIETRTPFAPARLSTIVLTLAQCLLLAMVGYNSGLFASLTDLLVAGREAVMIILVDNGVHLIFSLAMAVLLISALLIAPTVLLRDRFDAINASKAPNTALDSWLVDVLIDVAYATSVLGIARVIYAIDSMGAAQALLVSLLYSTIGLLAFRAYTSKRNSSADLSQSVLLLFVGLSAGHLYILM